MGEYDEDGMYHGERTTMRTHSGRRVEPMNLKVEDVNIEDIAHALSRQCRFNGHCNGFISVANHSIRVHDLLDGTEHQLWGLLHDAAETWLGDLIRPMKYTGEFQAYFEAEERAEQVIAEAFGLSFPIPQEVRDADREAALFELEKGWDFVSGFKADERVFLERFRRHQ